MDELEKRKIIKDTEILESRMIGLLPILKNHITEHYEDYLNNLITHSESGIAFEEIIETIIYCKVKLTQEDFKKIDIVGKTMQKNDQIWVKLKDQVECQ